MPLPLPAACPRSFSRVFLRFPDGVRLTAWLIFALLLSTARGETAVLTLRAVWANAPVAGSIEVHDGRLDRLELPSTAGTTNGSTYSFNRDTAGSLLIHVADARLNAGAGATRVTVRGGPAAFTFWARDVTATFPIYLPRLGVAITAGDDARDYAAIAAELTARGLRTKQTVTESAAETDFESASAVTRDQPAPTWLGLSRDHRLFVIRPAIARSGQEQEVIRIVRASTAVKLPEWRDREAAYGFPLGRGQGAAVNLVRRLEEGVLPILHQQHLDDDVQYSTVTFTTLERSPLRPENVQGTPHLVADLESAGPVLTPEQRARAEHQRENEKPSEQVVLYRLMTVKNTGDAPRYAWLKAPKPGASWTDRAPYEYDPTTGFSRYSDDRVFSISLLDGQPFPQEEMAILLQPGQSLQVDFRLPHEPITAEAARALADQDATTRHHEVRDYWRAKLASAGRWKVPEPRVDEMLRAGLLHLDLATYGRDPDEPLAPTIGVYPPIGTESAPIILTYASVGWYEQARRCLDYFVGKQRPDGSIMNFNDYMIETGAALWVMGEYNRYTPDPQWAQSVLPAVRKATQHLLEWRARNRTNPEEPGYGMIDGKVADPRDPYRQFMLNAYGYAGLSRAAELLRSIQAPEADALAQTALEWRADIQAALEDAMARSPVVPLGDGRWSRPAPPWPETLGLRALYATGEKQFTHATFTAADSALGPLHLVFCEVLDPSEDVTEELLEVHHELLAWKHVAFSQPYYSRHPWIHLQRGETKAFLEGWYHAFAALADRETYTFWEHFYQVSPHKTHEEAWFLMETRWMLYLESGDTLKLLAGVPRAWLADGKQIAVERGGSRFGELSFNVTSAVGSGRITGELRCDGDRRPSRVEWRIPHPEAARPRSVRGGTYDADREVVVIEPFDGHAAIELQF